jgi:hypothetical protein
MSSITVSTLERKRSVEHTPIDLETAIHQFTIPKDELEGSEATTENDMISVMKQVNALQVILRGPKTPVCV